MKSSDSNNPDTSKWGLEDWLYELHLRLGATEDLMKTYLLRDEAYFTKLAAETATETEHSPNEIQSENRRVVLRHLISIFRPLTKVLKHIERDLPITVIDKLVEELWDIERGGRNWLLLKPVGMGRGNRPSVSTSLHRVLIACAYDEMISEGLDKEAAISGIANSTGLRKSTVSTTIKDFKEGAKDPASLRLYKMLSGTGSSSEDFLILFNQEHLQQRG